MSELRIVQTVVAAAASWAAAAHCAEPRPLPQELYLPVVASHEHFLVPHEHIIGDPLPFAAPSESDTSPDGEFLARFSGAWLAAHVEGFQPILNAAFQSATAYILVTPKDESPPDLVPAIARDVWFAGYGWEQREVTGERESNTGLYIIKQVPSPSDRDVWSGVLAESLPVEGQPYPKDPPWTPIVCSHFPMLILPASRSYTTCMVWGRVDSRISYSVNIAGENLRIRDAAMTAIGEEILRWRALAGRHGLDGSGDADTP